MPSARSDAADASTDPYNDTILPHRCAALKTSQPPEVRFVFENPSPRQSERKPAPATAPSKPPQWQSRVHEFLKKMPQGDSDWEDKLPSVDAISRLRDKLVMAHIPPRFRADMKWKKLLSECCKHKTGLSGSECSFFTWVHCAVCFFALRNGYDEDEVNLAMLAFSGDTKSDRTLSRMRTASKRGVLVLNTIARHQGLRALALPYYDLSCLSLFEHCSTQCLAYLEGHVPVVKRVSCEAFEDLYMPQLVYLLLGGEYSKSSYSLICKTFEAPEHCPVHTGAQQASVNHEMNDILQDDA